MCNRSSWKYARPCNNQLSACLQKAEVLNVSAGQFAIIYTLSLFAIGFVASLFRLAADDHRQSIWYCLGVSGLSGLFSFAVVAVTFRSPLADGYDHYLCAGVAALLGWVGNDVKARIVDQLLAKIGIKSEDKQ